MSSTTLSVIRETVSYRDEHLAKAWSKRVVYRTLKRAVAREVFAR